MPADRPLLEGEREDLLAEKVEGFGGWHDRFDEATGVEGQEGGGLDERGLGGRGEQGVA